MLEHAKSLIKRLVMRANMAWRSRRLERETSRLNRLYGALPRQETPKRLDETGQAQQITLIVRAHCAASEAIVAAHSTASIKLDAAEYAFSSLLQELRGAMAVLPTDWLPARAHGAIRQIPAAASSIRAA